MSERALILLLVVASGVLLLGFYGLYRKRSTPLPDRLEMADLGLELMEGCCAFVIFTTPSCRPCKAALQVVSEVAARAPGPTEVVTVDATERPEVALACNVRTIPTVFLITASGHVVNRWREVPDPAEAAALLASV